MVTLGLVWACCLLKAHDICSQIQNVSTPVASPTLENFLSLSCLLLSPSLAPLLSVHMQLMGQSPGI